MLFMLAQLTCNSRNILHARAASGLCTLAIKQRSMHRPPHAQTMAPTYTNMHQHSPTCRKDGSIRSVQAALDWLRTTARSFRPSTPRPLPSTDAPSTSTAAPTSTAGPAEAAYYRSLLLRANILMCKLPIHTDGVSFTAAISEEADSDDDDNEPVVEPLRQRNAQAVVLATIWQPGKLTEEEKTMVSIDLWRPEETVAQYARREVQDVHAVEAWRALLPHDALHNTTGMPLREQDVRCGYSAVWLYGFGGGGASSVSWRGCHETLALWTCNR